MICKWVCSGSGPLHCSAASLRHGRYVSFLPGPQASDWSITRPHCPLIGWWACTSVPCASQWQLPVCVVIWSPGGLQWRPWTQVIGSWLLSLSKPSSSLPPFLTMRYAFTTQSCQGESDSMQFTSNCESKTDEKIDQTENSFRWKLIKTSDFFPWLIYHSLSVIMRRYMFSKPFHAAAHDEPVCQILPHHESFVWWR